MNKGFTLIELLAVIIILAIIALISVPIINIIINGAEKKSFESTAHGIVRAGEHYVGRKSMISSEKSENKTFICDGISCKADDEILDIEGQIPNYGVINISSNGSINMSLSNDKWCLIKSMNSSEMEVYECNNLIFIESIEDLVVLAKEVDSNNDQEGKTYVLTRSLDFTDDNSYDDSNSTFYEDINGDGTINNIKTELTTSTGWNPIGYVNMYSMAPFSGNFNGLENEIKNLYINRNVMGQGLFSLIFGTVKNLNLTGEITSQRNSLGLLTALLMDGFIENVNVSGKVEGITERGSAVGLLAGEVGRMIAEAGIKNCNVDGAVIGYEVVGGLIGYGDSLTIENCKSNVTVNGNYDTGGLIGFGRGITVKNSKSTATVTGINYIGGLIGYCEYSTIGNSSANSTVTGEIQVGGLLGQGYDNTEIYNSYSKGEVIGTGAVGGMMGLLYGTMRNSYSYSNVTSSEGNNVGGLVGIIGCTDCDHSTVLVENSYTTGSVTITGSSEGGSLVGQNGGSTEGDDTRYMILRNSYALGNINGIDQIGLIGINIMNAENIFNGGQVVGTTNTSDIVGYFLNTDSVVTNAYSVTQLNPITNNTGSIVSINDLKTSNWYINSLGLNNNWHFEDGYYPLLYKLDEDGNPTTTLLEGQTKIKVE